jgi:triosephosphate isomerase
MTSDNLPTLKDVYIAHKTAIVRCGFDVPLDEGGNITDDSRIKESLPTLRYLLEHDAKKVIVITHLGRPEKKETNLRTKNVAERLSKLLGVKTSYIDGWSWKKTSDMPAERVIVLENLRFNPGEKDKDAAKRDAFGKQLASLADFYVNDAFSNCHRDHASMTSIPKFIPGCVGLSVEREVATITSALKDPQRPFVSIIGGVKADKLASIGNLLDRGVDRIYVAGALGFTLLRYFGRETGKTKVDMDGLSAFNDVLKRIRDNPKVWLPVDAVLADRFDADAHSKIVSCDSIDNGWMALDIGPTTVKQYLDDIKTAKTILWNGPIGVFEFDRFAKGTKDIALGVADRTRAGAVTIIGGGDSGAAVHKLGLDDKMTLVSTGGGASLKLFEGKTLVAIECLRNKKEKK